MNRRLFLSVKGLHISNNFYLNVKAIPPVFSFNCVFSFYDRFDSLLDFHHYIFDQFLVFRLQYGASLYGYKNIFFFIEKSSQFLMLSGNHGRNKPAGIFVSFQLGNPMVFSRFIGHFSSEVLRLGNDFSIKI